MTISNGSSGAWRTGRGDPGFALRRRPGVQPDRPGLSQGWRQGASGVVRVVGARPAFDPWQVHRAAEERERLRDRGQRLSRNLADRSAELRSSAAALAVAVENVRIDLERLVELTERLAELDG